MSTRRAPALAIAVCAIVAALPLAGLGVGLLFVLPAVIVLLLIAAGWFPGEGVLTAAARRYVVRARRAARKLAGPRPLRVLHPRGGELLAASLAERAPPLL